MRKIVWEGAPYGIWDPKKDEILMPSDPYYKKRAPMIFAHELGHSEFEHTGGTSPLGDLIEERDAWKYALSKLPPDEIDVEFLNDVLNSSVQDVEAWYGEGKELNMAKKLSREIIALAWKKKGVM